jgi:hypothetical protein
MNKSILISAGIALSVAALATATVITTQGKYSIRVPNGLAFSEFKGYEDWSAIAVSLNGGRIAVILGNPETIRAYKSGIPGNGKPFPEGSKIAKIHWIPRKNELQPGGPTIPGALHDIDFMVKDSKRFADSGGWGYAAFEYGAASGTFRPGNLTDMPPQAHDAKCGFACHTIAKSSDFVFTAFGKR